MEKLRTFIAITAVRLLGALSIAQARKLGGLFGRAAYRFNTRMAVITRNNVDACLPALNAQARAELSQRSLAHTGMVAAEVCGLFTKRKPLDAYICDIDGEQCVREALAVGKGVVVLAPHLGNWEVLGLYLPTLAPVTNLYQPPKLGGLDRLIRDSRSQTGARLVPTNARGVSALLKTLKSGGICGILPDQNPNDRGSGDFAPFFGHQAFTMTLVHKLLVKTEARAVFAFAKRTDSGFELVFRPAPEDLYSADSSRSLAALNRGVEALVLEAPEQYQWEYKRFKVQPEGAKSVHYP